MTHDPRMDRDRPIAPPARHAWYGSGSAGVSRFLHALQGLPARAWLAASDAVTDARPRAAEKAYVPLMEELADQAARHRLHEALETMPDVVTHVRRRVDDLLYAFDDVLPAPVLARMRRAARLAALAIAAQPHLRPEDVARLCRPFRGLVPIGQMHPRTVMAPRHS